MTGLLIKTIENYKKEINRIENLINFYTEMLEDTLIRSLKSEIKGVLFELKCEVEKLNDEYKMILEIA